MNFIAVDTSHWKKTSKRKKGADSLTSLARDYMHILQQKKSQHDRVSRDRETGSLDTV